MKNIALVFATLLSLSTFVQAKEAKTVKKALNSDASSVSWLGKKKLVGDKHYGKIKIKEGSIVMDAKGQPKEAEVVIDMKSITNEDLKDKKYNKKLVGHLSSADFFDVEKYPTSVLKIKSFAKTKVDKKSKDKNANMFKAIGDLTIKDKTEKVAFDVKINKVDSAYQSMGKLTIDRTKWDVRYGSDSFFKGLGDKVIADDMDFEFVVVTAD